MAQLLARTSKDQIWIAPDLLYPDPLADSFYSSELSPWTHARPIRSCLRTRESVDAEPSPTILPQSSEELPSELDGEASTRALQKRVRMRMRVRFTTDGSAEDFQPISAPVIQGTSVGKYGLTDLGAEPVFSGTTVVSLPQRETKACTEERGQSSERPGLARDVSAAGIHLGRQNPGRLERLISASAAFSPHRWPSLHSNASVKPKPPRYLQTLMAFPTSSETGANAAEATDSAPGHLETPVPPKDHYTEDNQHGKPESPSTSPTEVGMQRDVDRQEDGTIGAHATSDLKPPTESTDSPGSPWPRSAAPSLKSDADVSSQDDNPNNNEEDQANTVSTGTSTTRSSASVSNVLFFPPLPSRKSTLEWQNPPDLNLIDPFHCEGPGGGMTAAACKPELALDSPSPVDADINLGLGDPLKISQSSIIVKSSKLRRSRTFHTQTTPTPRLYDIMRGGSALGSSSRVRRKSANPPRETPRPRRPETDRGIVPSSRGVATPTLLRSNTSYIPLSRSRTSNPESPLAPRWTSAQEALEGSIDNPTVGTASSGSISTSSIVTQRIIPPVASQPAVRNDVAGNTVPRTNPGDDLLASPVSRSTPGTSRATSSNSIPTSSAAISVDWIG